MPLQVFVGTAKGAFVYTRNPDGWSVEGPILPGWKVSAVARDGAGGFVLASSSFVYGAMVHRGKTLIDWELQAEPPRYAKESDFELKEIWTLVGGEGVVYAGVDEAGLFESRDSGATWTEVRGLTAHSTRSAWFPGLGGLCNHHVLARGQRIWTAISAVGVFESTDGGATWHTRNTGVKPLIVDEVHKDIGTCVHAIVADPEDADRIWRQDHVGMFRTADGGATWEETQVGLPSTFGFPLVRDHAERVLFSVPLQTDEFRYPVDGKLRVFRSRDDGDSWHACGNGLPDDSWHAVLRQAMAADQRGGIYFGNAGGEVYATADLGEKFERLPGSLPRILCVEAFTDAEEA
jgi:hypothetical protein